MLLQVLFFVWRKHFAELGSVVKFLLELLRLFHKVLGITAPAPEHERAFLFVWIGVVIMIVLLGTAFFLFLVPRIIQ